jgi:hypothetical protein
VFEKGVFSESEKDIMFDPKRPIEVYIFWSLVIGPILSIVVGLLWSKKRRKTKLYNETSPGTQTVGVAAPLNPPDPTLVTGAAKQLE